MDELKPKKERKLMDETTAEELRAEATAKHPIAGTKNFRDVDDRKVDHAFMKPQSLLAHDNLEADTEVDKDSAEQGRSADGSFR
ncbi:MAG: hypothetical protein HYS26_00970 [Candidatus Kaiserbacteria bacterium]|nr:MAG: hypothetical protein HYS26_00970 [Candidatus Kaiserbacteria bacterium]